MRILRSYLAGASVCLGLAGPSFAQTRAAELLPPQAAPIFVPRGSSDGILSEESPAPTPPKVKPRDPNFQYPPTFNKRSDFSISGAWDRLTSISIFGSEEKKPATASASVAKQPIKQASAQVAVHRPQPPIVAGPAPIVATPIAAATAVAAPAWHWYGYGAPVPGKNPYAPDGVYGQVHPNWYHQNGATPGAIPRPLMPILPFPTTDEPPLPKPEGSAELPRLPLELVPDFKSDVKPASLEMPVPQVENDSRGR